MTYLEKYKSCSECPIEAICDIYWDTQRICNSLDNKEEVDKISHEIMSEIGVCDPNDCL